jgi:hypothetical protein
VPDSVVRLADASLLNNPYIKTLTIGKNCQSIETWDETDGVGVGCKNLKTIKVNPKNKYFMVKNGVLYNKKGTVLKLYPQGLKAKSFTLPKTVKTIAAKYGFANNKALKKLSVESGNKRFVSDGRNFYVKSSGAWYAGLDEPTD